MQTYVVDLECVMSDSFRAQKAGDSVNLDPKTKSKHHLRIDCDINDFNVGLILGASGSGKTTLAKKLFGDNFDKNEILDQMPKELSYEDCIDALTGIGLTSIPCWMRPVYTLSNGQKNRAQAALKMASSKSEEIIAIDEWTSVVDRDTAKVMSHKLQKEARSKNKKIVLLSCHYDVIEWLNPDFIIDCNLGTFLDRKKKGEVETHQRQDKLRLELRECSKDSWKFFSKYHYLSQHLAPDTKHCFGLFLGDKQISFCAFTRYAFKNKKMLHSNRVVVHPDYVGLGLGIKMVDEASEYLTTIGYEIRAKFTSIAMLKSRLRNPRWRLIQKQKIKSVNQNIIKGEVNGSTMKQVQGRNDAKLFFVNYFIFSYIPRKF